MSLLSKPFDGGDGPGHSTIELVFAEADASDFLPKEGNKLARVLGGLQRLAAKADDSLNSDYDRKLEALVSGLAAMLMTKGAVDEDELDAALAKDGLSTYRGKPVKKAEPADKLALLLTELFGDSPRFRIARNHYEQATRAFERHDWEAANGQFRSACDAAFDALAHQKGCHEDKKGGSARKWLQDNGYLEDDEANLIKAFVAFAGRDGSHAGISEESDAQLRRHMATALISFAVLKLDETGPERLALL